MFFVFTTGSSCCHLTDGRSCCFGTSFMCAWHIFHECLALFHECLAHLSCVLASSSVLKQCCCSSRIQHSHSSSLSLGFRSCLSLTHSAMFQPGVSLAGRSNAAAPPCESVRALCVHQGFIVIGSSLRLTVCVRENAREIVFLTLICVSVVCAYVFVVLSPCHLTVV